MPTEDTARALQGCLPENGRQGIPDTALKWRLNRPGSKPSDPNVAVLQLLPTTVAWLKPPRNAAVGVKNDGILKGHRPERRGNSFKEGEWALPFDRVAERAPGSAVQVGGLHDLHAHADHIQGRAGENRCGAGHAARDELFRGHLSLIPQAPPVTPSKASRNPRLRAMLE
eukprot:scaffold140_cov565-Prasinococcus_capsulatus_cf.AAC.15